MKLKKRNFKIRKFGSGYNVYFYGAPLTKDGYPTRKAAKKRLAEYFKNVKLAS